ncbi:hypothetical protein CMQ_1646 [Grosmannia clavigera kw1407]|uniref:Uncharacterized protein n=1 Tax=Grosmannia clavigera (strain kw1407 / UAMH 11150) TaxID=655863 RepID=F0XF09_GROCL|nr:uncharacterized protein CMQ_1646 [Grosmannia clavigera kw1407]EFX04718.1 hypothetical protein CMQ_1646 [Grosmannia clavigera kw1407]
MASQVPGELAFAGPGEPYRISHASSRPTGDVECVWVNASCGVQTLQSRVCYVSCSFSPSESPPDSFQFGSAAREVIYSRLEKYMDFEDENEGSGDNENWDGEDESEEDEASEYDEDEDEHQYDNDSSEDDHEYDHDSGNESAAHNDEDYDSSETDGMADGLLQNQGITGGTSNALMNDLATQTNQPSTQNTQNTQNTQLMQSSVHTVFDGLGTHVATGTAYIGLVSAAMANALSGHVDMAGPGDPGGPGGPSQTVPLKESVPLHGTNIPRVARARVNLTALSQRYNVCVPVVKASVCLLAANQTTQLYFAVYQDKIHVYRPQPAPEILRGPQLILCPGPSSAARTIGGYIDPKFPHQANHAIVGNLGSQEILLLGYDDGDVIAYYTHHIRDYLERRSRRPRRRQQQQQQPLKKPKPFFHQTVGMSAWGLAIHAQSRLIAVSSNLYEVNVFAFALYPPSPSRSAGSTGRLGVFHRPPAASADGRPTSDLELLRLLHLRDRNWRILLPLGLSGHNMPGIAFIDDANGDAEKVIGVDIHGNAWFLDLWKVGVNRALVILPPVRGDRPIGWGILPLPAKAFVKSKRMPPMSLAGASAAGSLGIPDLLNFTGDNDLSCPENFQRLATDSQANKEAEGEQESDDESWGEDSSDEHDSVLPVDTYTSFSGGGYKDGSEYDSGNGQGSCTTVSSSRSSSGNTPSHHRHNHGRYGSEEQHHSHDFQLGSVICPSLSLAWPDLSMTKLVTILRCAPQRQRQVKDLMLTGSEKIPELLQMAKRLSILRTFGLEADLFTTGMEKAWGVFSNKLMEPPVASNYIWDMNANYHRLSLLESIPEIGVVIVGGMFGRVAVLRLIRGSLTSRGSGNGSSPRLKRCFRTEWVLPRHVEEKKKLRPPCCLLGIAVSPVPEAGASMWDLASSTKKRQQEARSPRRWRLILHYMDHSVLQYYIEERSLGRRRQIHLSV